MKFVKANLDLVICGVIALLALGACYWPISSLVQKTRDDANERIKLTNNATSLIFTKDRPIDVPGVGKLPAATEDRSVTITYEKNVIAAKVQAQEQMKKEADEVTALASRQNLQNRVKVIKGATPNSDRYIPLLAGGKQVDGFLPNRVNTPWAFKSYYEAQFNEWLTKLTGQSVRPEPLQKEIENRLAEYLVEKSRAAAPSAPGPGGAAAAQAQAQITPEEKVFYTKGVVSNRAANTRCYVDEGALQRRAWSLTGGTPPLDEQIFEAFVDSWILNETVNAITSLNDSVLNRQPEDYKNVAKSPIKRVESITVGGPDGSGTGLFFSMTGPAAAAITGAPLTPSNFTTVTGHTGTSEYDVILLNIKIVIDPAYQNQFIDALYRQNNGYTVLNIKTTPVDPLDAASNGYLYGDTQCVLLEIRAENLFFRNWTMPLMPPATRAALGLAPALPGR
jgi:hypothetical protein